MLENCINIGNVEVLAEEPIKVGGIVGADKQCREDYTIQNVFNKGTITATMQITDSEQLRIGGIIGDAEAYMAHCYNMGKVQHIAGASGKETKYIASIMGEAHSRKYFECEYLIGTAEYGSKGNDVNSTSDDNYDSQGNEIFERDETVMTENYVIGKLNDNVRVHNATNEDKWTEWSIVNGTISIVK